MTSQALEGQTSQELGGGLAGPAPQPALCTADLSTPLHAAALQPGGLAQPWLCRRGQVHTDLTHLRAVLGLARFAPRCLLCALYVRPFVSVCPGLFLSRAGQGKALAQMLVVDLIDLGLHIRPCLVCPCGASLAG